jgi:hypothetical protein
MCKGLVLYHELLIFVLQLSIAGRISFSHSKASLRVPFFSYSNVFHYLLPRYVPLTIPRSMRTYALYNRSKVVLCILCVPGLFGMVVAIVSPHLTLSSIRCQQPGLSVGDCHLKEARTRHLRAKHARLSTKFPSWVVSLVFSARFMQSSFSFQDYPFVHSFFFFAYGSTLDRTGVAMAFLLMLVFDIVVFSLTIGRALTIRKVKRSGQIGWVRSIRWTEERSLLTVFLRDGSYIFTSPCFPM